MLYFGAKVPKVYLAFITFMSFTISEYHLKLYLLFFFKFIRCDTWISLFSIMEIFI